MYSPTLNLLLIEDCFGVLTVGTAGLPHLGAEHALAATKCPRTELQLCAINTAHTGTVNGMGIRAGLVTTTVDLGKSPTNVQYLIHNSQIEKALQFSEIYFFVSLAPHSFGGKFLPETYILYLFHFV